MTDNRLRRLHAALAAQSAQTRLQAALAAGTNPDRSLTRALIERCAVEPDFYVRDMLTWALTRQEPAPTLSALRAELGSTNAQGRSQALHTLSKIGDRSAWPDVTHALLTDPDDDVARSAWRAAVDLVPPAEMSDLAAILASQLGRGDAAVQRSLSRAFVALGEEVALPVLHSAQTAPDPVTRGHATATEALVHDPDAGFAFDVEEARRISALGEAALGQ
ncbi:HEAT repeat domain-containing protein [Gordonia neofelifaecis]|uniref:HEAT repeat domain-containing protein n=1 Tax=Gordonia neofelifaecis NRRL B-59395 TaxID=644548 RepID=F1YEF2_9ACTN|nr:HEAT repeat domain-containing protein [Gordonia neofelifaecis]EGD56785.1 hypothetical protein SCNU_00365 [Gordonia neofelifaecis NRRL B-59395]